MQTGSDSDSVTDFLAETPGSPVLDLARLGKPLDFARLFGRPGPVAIEVGIGSGYFLSRYALDRPELNLLGIDQAPGEVRRSADKCTRLGATNVRVLCCDAIYFLYDYPAAASVDEYHVYYSDPWHKRRHQKRRLWRPEFLDVVARTLRPGGALFLKTDVTDYFTVINGLLKGHEAFRLLDDRRLDNEPLEGDYETNFQRKAIRQGHPLHYQQWERVGEDQGFADRQQGLAPGQSKGLIWAPSAGPSPSADHLASPAGSDERGTEA
jgi:tRNA (guanine-N7-)-methyltransferase